MLILKRKSTAPIFNDNTGCDRPDMVLALLAPVEDKRNKMLELNLAYYHSKQAYLDGKTFIPEMPNITMRFTKDYKVEPVYEGETLLKLGWPKYAEVLMDCHVDDNGDLVADSQEVLYWLLNQEFALDFEGKKFSENWEFE